MPLKRLLLLPCIGLRPEGWKEVVFVEERIRNNKNLIDRPLST
jgi:hypothetical protein